jgi:hypothetical protein
VREPNPDRYLAACEDRDADRRLSDEDLDRQSRREDAYAKMLNCPVYQRVVLQGLPPEGYVYSDDGELVEAGGGDDDWECDQDRDREMEDRS